MPQTMHLIYFSPTQTSKIIVEQIAKGFGSAEQREYDMTREKDVINLRLQDGLAIFGFPVYAGRVPELFLERIAGLSAAGVPAVLVALYGNREYEDALVEMQDVAEEKGFSVVGAAAFIGEHSYSTGTQPIAAGRPDAADRQTAREFGAALAEQCRTGFHRSTPHLPGKRPYRERVPLGGVAPETNPALCTLCGRCAAVCPTFVIAVDQQVMTDAAGCVMCCACVKSCPENARAMDHPRVAERRLLLVANCQRRKEPEVFL